MPFKAIVLALTICLSFTGIAGPNPEIRDLLKEKQERVYVEQSIEALQMELGKLLDGDEARFDPHDKPAEGFFSCLLTKTKKFLSDHATLLQAVTAAALLSQGCEDPLAQLLFLREAHTVRFDLPLAQAPLVLERRRVRQPTETSIALTQDEREKLLQGSLRQLAQLSSVAIQVRTELLSILEQLNGATTEEQIAKLIQQFNQVLQKNYWRGGFIMEALQASLAGNPTFETTKARTTFFVVAAIALVEKMGQDARALIIKDSGSDLARVEDNYPIALAPLPKQQQEALASRLLEPNTTQLPFTERLDDSELLLNFSLLVNAGEVLEHAEKEKIVCFVERLISVTKRKETPQPTPQPTPSPSPQKRAAEPDEEARKRTTQTPPADPKLLVDAVMKGDVKKVSALLQAGADPNASTWRYKTPLSEALNEKNIVILKLLLDYGADPNGSGCGLIPVIKAILLRDAEAVSLLLAYGADPNRSLGYRGTPLIEAVTNGDVEAVRLLLAHGADPNVSPVYSALRGSTPLFVALGAPESPDKHRTVQLLLAHGADPNAIQKYCNGAGQTPFFRAVSESSSGIVQLLLDHGADPKAPLRHPKYLGQTPLFVAARKGPSSIVSLLLETGLDPNEALQVGPNEGCTPLTEAILQNRPAVVRLLLDHGADPALFVRTGNHKWSTPLTFSQDLGHADIVKMLEEAVQQRYHAYISPLSSAASQPSAATPQSMQTRVPRIIISDRYLRDQAPPEVAGFANHRDVSWLSTPSLTLSRIKNAEPAQVSEFSVEHETLHGRLLMQDATPQTLQRFTFVFPGRMEKARIPAESEGGVVILVVPTKDEAKARQWLGPHIFILVVEHIDGIDDEHLGLIAARRLAALLFAQSMIGDHFILLDDNLEHFYLDNGTTTLTWTQLYNRIAEAASQNGVHYLSGRTFRPEIDRHAPSGSLTINEGEFGSKIAFFSKEIFTSHSDIRTLVPHRMDIWGEDIWRQLILMKSGVKIGVIDRGTLLYTRARALPGAAAKSAISANTWLSETPLEGRFREHADVLAQMQSIVRQNIATRQTERDRIAQLNLAQLTQSKNGVAPAASLQRPIRPLLAEEQYREALLQHLSHAIGNLVASKNLGLMAHQIQALRNLGTYLEQKNYVGYFDMATGTGKTWLFLAVAALAMQNQVYLDHRNIAIVVPTIDLVDQVYAQIQNFNRALGEELQIDLSKVIKVSSFDVKQKALQLNHNVNTNGGHLLIICSDSLSAFINEQSNGNKSVNELFSMFIIDEMHRAGDTLVSSLADTSARLQSFVTLGFSATPGKNKERLGKNPIFSYSTEDGIEDGLLCDFQIMSLQTRFSSDALNEQMELLPHLFKRMLREGVSYRDAGGIIWVPSIAWANTFADMLKSIGFTAEAVHSKQPAGKNKETLDNFHSGSVKVLVAVDMLTLGFDAKVDYAVILKKVRHWDTWVQMRGRLLRRHGDPDKVASIWAFDDSIPKETTASPTAGNQGAEMQYLNATDDPSSAEEPTRDEVMDDGFDKEAFVREVVYRFDVINANNANGRSSSTDATFFELLRDVINRTRSGNSLARFTPITPDDVAAWSIAFLQRTDAGDALYSVDGPELRLVDFLYSNL